MNDVKLSKIDNGLRVVSVRMPSTGTVTLLALFGAGSEYETKEKNGISHFYEHMVFKGTEKRPRPWDVSQAIESLGGMANAFTGEIRVGYWIKVANEFIQDAAEIVSDILFNSVFDEKEIKGEKTPVIQEIKGVLDHPAQHAGVVFKELLYGDQPAGWEIAGTPKNVRRFGRRDIIDQVERFYTAANAVIVFAGDITHARARELAEKYFSPMKQGGKSQKPAVAIHQSSPQCKIVSRNTNQTYAILGFRGYNAFHPDRHAIKLLSVILGGGMSSRLFVEVREKAGLVYFIHTSAENALDHGEFETIAGVDESNLSRAIDIILREHQRTIREVAKEELDRAKTMIKGNIKIALEDSLKVAEFYGGTVLTYNRAITPREELEKMEAVTLEDIKRVAADIFKKKSLNLVALGPVKKEDKRRLIRLLESF